MPSQPTDARFVPDRHPGPFRQGDSHAGAENRPAAMMFVRVAHATLSQPRPGAFPAPSPRAPDCALPAGRGCAARSPGWPRSRFPPAAPRASGASPAPRSTGLVSGPTGLRDEAIAPGDFPEWDLAMQVFDQALPDSLPHDVLDATKLIPEEVVPLRVIGRMVPDRNPDNFFAETEQVAFLPSNILPGIDRRLDRDAATRDRRAADPAARPVAPVLAHGSNGEANGTEARLPFRWPRREIGKTAGFFLPLRPIDMPLAERVGHEGTTRNYARRSVTRWVCHRSHRRSRRS